jgi:asparagine synthase (glutamine-hydrolysing)
MCGIAGFIGTGERRDALAMQNAVRHRGPDDEGLWIDEKHGVHLVHTRLAIIDPLDGRQPMCNRDGSLVVVFNGEIYNHAELRVELEQAGHRFQTNRSDTEVLLHGYRQWGDALPQRLNGMWAFALYDRASGTLFLSRDRFGEKPLFYTLQSGTFAFGSELTAVTAHSRVAAEIAPLGVQKYLAFGFLPAPKTIYQQIAKLPAGHNLLVNAADLSYRLSR